MCFSVWSVVLRLLFVCFEHSLFSSVTFQNHATYNYSNVTMSIYLSVYPWDTQTSPQTLAPIGWIVIKFRHADLAGAIDSGGHPSDIRGYQRFWRGYPPKVCTCFSLPVCRRAFHLSVNGNLRRNQLKSLTSKLRDTFDVCIRSTLKCRLYHHILPLFRPPTLYLNAWNFVACE